MNTSREIKSRVIALLALEIESSIARTKEQVDALMKHANEAPGAMQSASDGDKQHYSKLADEQRAMLMSLQAGLAELQDLDSLGGAKESVVLGTLVKISHRGPFLISPIASKKFFVEGVGEIAVVSNSSPLGEALIGKKVGDEVIIGENSFVIEETV